MLISIVIPTYNEEKDIERTLEAVLAQRYPEREIIVVDDSTDGTPAILARYGSRGVRVIRRRSRANGCCGARNRGILESRGEVVVLLNADVVPAPDFLDRLAALYADGADFVVPQARVLNQESLYARYVGAAAAAHYLDADWLTWSEGFSCRRSAALGVGLIPGDYPIPFCRDGLFGIRLQDAGYRKRLAPDLVVEHVAPASLREYWQVRRARGRISVLFKFFVDGVPLPLLPLRVLLKAVLAAGGVALGAPLLRQVLAAARHSPRGRREVPGFLLAAVLERLAFSIGEWSGCAAVVVKAARGELPRASATAWPSRWRGLLGERRRAYVRGRAGRGDA